MLLALNRWRQWWRQIAGYKVKLCVQNNYRGSTARDKNKMLYLTTCARGVCVLSQTKGSSEFNGVTVHTTHCYCFVWCDNTVFTALVSHLLAYPPKWWNRGKRGATSTTSSDSIVYCVNMNTIFSRVEIWTTTNKQPLYPTMGGCSTLLVLEVWELKVERWEGHNIVKPGQVFGLQLLTETANIHIFIFSFH